MIYANRNAGAGLMKKYMRVYPCPQDKADENEDR